MKVKTILVSQPEPKVEFSLLWTPTNKVKIDFRPFIHIEGVNAKVRLQNRSQSLYCIILTSRNAVDHFLE
jgi:uroporphyrinogen-III synthase